MRNHGCKIILDYFHLINIGLHYSLSSIFNKKGQGLKVGKQIWVNGKRKKKGSRSAANDREGLRSATKERLGLRSAANERGGAEKCGK